MLKYIHHLLLHSGRYNARCQSARLSKQLHVQVLLLRLPLFFVLMPVLP